MTDELQNLKNAKNIGILGGTFDPVHLGHISLARAVLKSTGVEQVLFIPNGLPPHKDAQEVTPARIRLEMTRAAVAEETGMSVSSMEVTRAGYSYTVDTVSRLKEMLGLDTKLKFITGADAMFYISSWKNYKTLLKNCSFIAVTRPGYNKKVLLDQINKMENGLKCDIEFVEIPPVDVSSSQIRQMVKDGQDISALVPREVAAYIKRTSLYK